jgi:hypothetical protein
LTDSSGCPASSALRYRRRPVSGLPRILYPPVPADGSPSCPASRTIRFASGKSPGLPESSLLWSSPRGELPGCPDSSLRWLRCLTNSPGCPKSPVAQRCRLTSFRVTPNLRLSAIRLCFLRLPRFRIYGWVDDESPAVLELCILWLAPRMNLRVQRVQPSLPDLPCSLNLSLLSTLACASSEPLQSTDPAFPARPELPSNSLQVPVSFWLRGYHTL